MDSPAPKQRFSVTFDLRFIVIALLLVIAAMLIAWRPWQATKTGERTVSVTGETTIKAEPDEYEFSPSYQFQNSDKNTAIAEATAKQTEVTAELKKLSVKDSQIKSDIDGYQDYDYQSGGRSGTYTYTLSYTITLPDRQTAQKIQDYVVTTSPLSSVTPYASFSDGLRKKLETRGRTEASKDARSQAEEQAKNLGFKVGKIKSIEDSNGFDGGIYGGLAMGASLDINDKANSTTASPTVQPGENELNYSVNIVYYIN